MTTTQFMLLFCPILIYFRKQFFRGKNGYRQFQRIHRCTARRLFTRRNGRDRRLLPGSDQFRRRTETTKTQAAGTNRRPQTGNRPAGTIDPHGNRQKSGRPEAGADQKAETGYDPDTQGFAERRPFQRFKRRSQNRRMQRFSAAKISDPGTFGTQSP